MTRAPARQRGNHDHDSETKSATAGHGGHRRAPDSAARPYLHEATAPLLAEADHRRAGTEAAAAYPLHPHNGQPADRHHSARHNCHDPSPPLRQFRRPPPPRPDPAGRGQRGHSGSARRPHAKNALRTARPLVRLYRGQRRQFRYTQEGRVTSGALDAPDPPICAFQPQRKTLRLGAHIGLICVRQHERRGVIRKTGTARRSARTPPAGRAVHWDVGLGCRCDPEVAAHDGCPAARASWARVATARPLPVQALT